jgi:hypothetical protein
VTDKSITVYKDLQSAPLADGIPVEVAVLCDDPEIGPTAVIIRFPAGYLS